MTTFGVDISILAWLRLAWKQTVAQPNLPDMRWCHQVLLNIIIWLLFVGDITRTLIG